MKYFNYLSIVFLLLSKSTAYPTTPWLKTSVANSLYPETALNPADVIQVTGPPPDYGPVIHTEILLEHGFANSTKDPLQLNYNPPIKNFTRVALTLMTKIQGVHSDRMVYIHVGDSEVWRLSTAEPGGHNLTSIFTKDVTKFISLFRDNQKITVLLENNSNEVPTGPISITLLVRYYHPEIDTDHDKGAVRMYDGEGDLLWQQYTGQVPPTRVKAVVPSRTPGLPNHKSRYWLTPPAFISTELGAFPRNVTRATIEIAASGFDKEEFWYSNLVDNFSNAMPGSGRGGPSRVVEILINNRLAGIVFPFPAIFPGGLSPYLWSPIVGINAFDIPTYQIDLSPFLPALWAGMTRLDIRVRNGYNLTSVNHGWLINANILTWETPMVVGNGNMELNNNASSINGTSNDDDLNNSSIGGFLPSNSSVFEVVSLLKGLSRSANLDFSGHKVNIEWQQACLFDNIQYASNRFEYQSVAQNTICAENISLSRPDVYGPSRLRTWQKMYQYPLAIQARHNSVKGKTDVEVTHGYDYTDSSTGVIATTTQNATATTFDIGINSTERTGYGSNRQVYLYQDKEKVYKRLAGAYNNTLVIDVDSRNATIYMNNYSFAGEGIESPSLQGNNINYLSKKYFDNEDRKDHSWRRGFLTEVESSLFNGNFFGDIGNDKVESEYVRRRIGKTRFSSNQPGKHEPLIARHNISR